MAYLSRNVSAEETRRLQLSFSRSKPVGFFRFLLHKTTVSTINLPFTAFIARQKLTFTGTHGHDRHGFESSVRRELSRTVSLLAQPSRWLHASESGKGNLKRILAENLESSARFSQRCLRHSTSSSIMTLVATQEHLDCYVRRKLCNNVGRETTYTSDRRSPTFHLTSSSLASQRTQRD